MKRHKFFLLVACCFLFSAFLSGCATVATKETLSVYTINGINYLPLASLCDSRGIKLEYDTLTRIVTLNKDGHRINLMAGDTLVLVDGNPQHLKHPVDIYQGAVVVPSKFKTQLLDGLFKQTYPVPKAVLPISRIKRLVIDAGHGGNDPGAIGRSGLREKDVNLDIAKRVSKLLRAYGMEVVMTRNSDRFIPLDKRAEIANASGADLFMSIHSNANRVRTLSGLEVYYVSPSVSDSKRALSSAKNASLNLDSSSFASHSQNLEAILWDMIYTNARREAIELSSSICKAMQRNLGVRILGIKGARFQVLRDTRMPAVLIEAGFLSNYNEERMLKNNYYRQKIAEGIVDGIKDYARDANLIEVTKR